MRIGSVFGAHVTATQEWVHSEGHRRAPREREIRGDLEARSRQINRRIDGVARIPWDEIEGVNVRPLPWRWWVPFACAAGWIVIPVAGLAMSAAAAVGGIAYLLGEAGGELWRFLTADELRRERRQRRVEEGVATPRDERALERERAREQRDLKRTQRREERERREAETERQIDAEENRSPAADELEIDLGAPWGMVLVQIFTPYGRVETPVAQRLLFRTTARRARALNLRYAELVNNPASRATLPDRDR